MDFDDVSYRETSFYRAAHDTFSRGVSVSETDLIDDELCYCRVVVKIGREVARSIIQSVAKVNGFKATATKKPQKAQPHLYRLSGIA